MDYYETLGVGKDATEAELKRAYRDKARRAHPDHGGSEEAMAAINVAYDCLSDPVRRKGYDDTGEDGVPDVEAAATSELCNMFGTMIDAGFDDIVANMKRQLKELGEKFEQDQQDVEEKVARLKKQRTKVRLKTKRNRRKSLLSRRNLYEMMVDRELVRLGQVLKQVEHSLKIHKCATEMLGDYEEEEGKTKFVLKKHISVPTKPIRIPTSFNWAAPS